MKTTRLPFSLSGVDLPDPWSAPGLGEHNAGVLHDWLGCSDDEINELQNRDVLK
jgi:formyl-CoA transferase